MSKMLERSSAIKLISILFAILLWIYVANTNNPTDTKDLAIPLRVVNEDSLQTKGIYIKNRNYDRNILITVRGRKEELKNVSENDFEVALDFAKVNDFNSRQLHIDDPKYTGKANVRIQDVSPRYIKLDLEKMTENSFQVKIVTVGNSKSSYKVIKTTATPENIIIHDLDSVLKSVASVKAFVDINDLDRDLVKKVECKIYNRDGKEITGLNGDLSVDIEVNMAKEVPVIPVIKGKPARNFIDGVRTVTPEKVLITGIPEALAKIESVKTEPVDIENASENVDVTRFLNLPEGVRLTETPQEVKVNVLIEQLAEKEFNLTGEDIALINTEIDNSLNYVIQTESITVKLKGNRKDLDRLNAGSLKPTVDVAGLGEGTHSIPLKFMLPNMVRLVQEYTVEVKIEKR